MRLLIAPCLVLLSSFTWMQAAEGLPPIPRKLPDIGKAMPEADITRLQTACDALGAQLLALGNPPLIADVAVYHKALQFALRWGEFYDAKKDLPKADWCLKQAQERLAAFKQAPWATQTGLVIRGYISAIDGTPQPYGLVIPEKLDLSKPCPLYVWLHGRGSNETDLHFMAKHAKSPDQIQPANAIVVHVFGRQCVGYKNAAETDVFEAIAHVQAHYKIDANRIALMGFSMGGAGAKHLGAHFADHFACMHTGAGFAETAQYQNLKPSDVPSYEAILWGQYDSPDYVRNLFNIPVIAYSGDEDTQMKAGIILGEAYAAHGKKLDHLIAPKTGHKYHPDYLKQVMSFVDKAVATGRNPQPDHVYFQSKTLRYSSMYWVEALELQQHWLDSRVDADATTKGIIATTKNIARLRLSHPAIKNGSSVTLDGQAIKISNSNKDGAYFSRTGDSWTETKTKYPDGLSKRPGLQGPIDDVFVRPFLVVLPSKSCADPIVDRWVKAESTHFSERWATLMRGTPRVKQDRDVTADDIATYHLILWGDAAANSLTAQVMAKLPIQWSTTAIQIGTQQFPSAGHVPTCIYPNPLNPNNYVVINSGLTFREGHDRTNSLQNPKLPDWAVIDLKTPPTDLVPGTIVAADFFDERWQVK